MKKSWIIIGIIAVIVLYIISAYNSMVTKQETVDQKWGDVQTQYQRRADLVDNLVNTVKGAAEFEKSTLTEVVQARANATSINISADDLTPENMKNFQNAQSQLSGALSRLLVTVEKYPELKANANFRDLQTQLEGTENRIAVSRNNFNEVVKDYNSSIRRFPNNMIAGFGDFQAKGYFEAEEGSEKAPKVEF